MLAQFGEIEGALLCPLMPACANSAMHVHVGPGVLIAVIAALA